MQSSSKPCQIFDLGQIVQLAGNPSILAVVTGHVTTDSNSASISPIGYYINYIIDCGLDTALVVRNRLADCTVCDGITLEKPAAELIPYEYTNDSDSSGRSNIERVYISEVYYSTTRCTRIDADSTFSAFGGRFGELVDARYEEEIINNKSGWIAASTNENQDFKVGDIVTPIQLEDFHEIAGALDFKLDFPVLEDVPQDLGLNLNGNYIVAYARDGYCVIHPMSMNSLSLNSYAMPLPVVQSRSLRLFHEHAYKSYGRRNMLPKFVNGSHVIVIVNAYKTIHGSVVSSYITGYGTYEYDVLEETSDTVGRYPEPALILYNDEIAQAISMNSRNCDGENNKQ